MKFKTLEWCCCTLAETTLEGQAECRKPTPYYESHIEVKGPPFRVRILKGTKTAYARSAMELCERLTTITPTLKEFSTAEPEFISLLLAFLEGRLRPIRDNVFWQEWASETGRNLDDHLPELQGDVLVWRSLEIGDCGTTIETNRFNAATGRFEKEKPATGRAGLRKTKPEKRAIHQRKA